MKPMPRIDDAGVPWCSCDKCPNYRAARDCADWCSVTARRTYEGSVCLPAVRAMSARLAELDTPEVRALVEAGRDFAREDRILSDPGRKYNPGACESALNRMMFAARALPPKKED